jgi:monoamine oxidase
MWTLESPFAAELPAAELPAAELPAAEGPDWETVAYETLLPEPAGVGVLRCRRFAGDPDLAAVLAGRLRLAAPGASPLPTPVHSQGTAVRRVQEALIAAGYRLPAAGADGVFGPETGQAVRRFKQDRRITPADPVVGPATLRALDGACAGGDPGCLVRTRVAVVGAGFAGLMAAWSLASGGMRVTLYEAAGRIGGRVRTDRTIAPGKVVEAGAELIGKNHPTTLLLMRRFGLRTEKVTKDADYTKRGLAYRIRLGDTDLTKAERDAIDAKLLEVWAVIAGEAAAVDALRPWTAPNAAALDAMSLAQRLDRPDLFGPGPSNARRYFEFVAENDQCAPTTRQSYLGYLSAVRAHALLGNPTAYWTHTETDRCKGGNDQIATHLARGVPDLRLNTAVTAIEIGTGSVRVEHGSATDEVDYVVLATSPQVWPTVRAPAPFRPADYRLSDGPAVKYLSVFEAPFWEKQKLAPSALWDRLGSVWDGTDNQGGGGKHCLSVYSGGGLVLDPARYATRLASFYPGYADSPKRMSLVDWPNERWVRTGYTVPAPGEVTTISKRLSAPFAGRLFFAGEHASPGYFGYMEGALLSGVLAAYRVTFAARAGCAPAR